MEVDDIFGYDRVAHASRVLVSASRQNELVVNASNAVQRKNLHFDHDIPFSKGGSSLTASNVRLLCAKHNLEKSDKILTIAPWIFASAAAAPHIHRLSG